ncbi:MAG: zinc-ribbon domain-containing protein [Myxococcales bacterium]|jgi:predicted Zn finger-like uncharacterized protein
MIVQCAACKARFKIADEKITARGVKVRCTKCSTTFVVRKDNAAPAPDAVPIGGKPPTGKAGSPPTGRPAPTSRATTLPPGALSRLESKLDPFAFRTSEPQPAGSPFSGAPAKPAAGSEDPFADIDLGGPSAPPPPADVMDMAMPDLIGVGSASMPSAPSPPQSADPFAGLGLQPPPAKPAADPFDSLGAASRAPTRSADPFAEPRQPPARGATDPFAALAGAAAAPKPAAPARDPFAAMQAAAPTPRPAVDPFAALAAPPQRPAAIPNDPFAGMQAAPRPSAPVDPFAALDGAAQAKPAAAASPSAALAAGGDPFANLDLGRSSPAAGPQPGPAAPAAPTFPPLDLGASPGAPADPFASVGGAPGPGLFDLKPSGSTGGALAGPGYGEIDLNAAASGLGANDPARLSPGGGDPFSNAAAAAELFGPRSPAPKPQPPVPPAAQPSIPLATERPSRPVRTLSGTDTGEAVAAAARAVAGAKWSRRLPTGTTEKRRSTASVLLNSAIVALLGAGLLAGTLYGTVRAAAGEIQGMEAVGIVADLIAEDVTNGLFETSAGRSIFFVRGKLRNIGPAPVGPVGVRVELLRGSAVARNSVAAAGGLPSPEDVYGLVNPAALASLNRRLAKSAAPIAAGETADFFVAFYEYPDDLASHEIRVQPEPFDKVARGQKEAPKKPKAAAPPSPPQETEKDQGEAAAASAAEPVASPPAAAPKNAKSAPVPTDVRQAEGDKIRFAPPAADKD